MIEQLQSYYFQKEEPAKSCLLVLRDIILRQDPHISETQKYGMPCFCYYKKMFCFLWTDKKTEEPYILIVDGNKLDHPQLESGNRKQTKILNINPRIDLPLETIETILQDALKLYRNGIIKVKKT